MTSCGGIHARQLDSSKSYYYHSNHSDHYVSTETLVEDDILDSDICEEEVKSVKQLKNNKTSGLDGIPSSYSLQISLDSLQICTTRFIEVVYIPSVLVYGVYQTHLPKGR